MCRLFVLTQQFLILACLDLGRRATAEMIAQRAFILLLRQLPPIPPAAAESLEKGGSVGKAVGLGLHQIELRLLVSLLGAQHRQVSAVANAPLLLRKIERFFGRLRRSG